MTGSAGTTPPAALPEGNSPGPSSAGPAARSGWWRPWPTLVSLVLLGVVALVVILGDLLAPFDPDAQNLMVGIAGPSADHWLGTDKLGRDILSRVIDGARNAIVGPLLVALTAVVIGTVLGLAAGYFHGRADTLIGRLVDVLYALPSLLIAIVVVGVSGGGYLAMVLVLAFLSLPTAIRMVRSATMAEAGKPYIEAAKSLRLSNRRIMFRHVLPNISATVLVTFLLDFVIAMIAFSALAFLGIGSQPGSSDWGVMIFDGRTQLFSNAMFALAPSILLILVAAAATVVGDALHDHLSQSEER